MAYHQFISNESSEPVGSFEAFFYHGIRSESADRLNPRGWYWQCCWPGCLPDGEPSGPFKTEADAIADANSF